MSRSKPSMADIKRQDYKTTSKPTPDRPKTYVQPKASTPPPPAKIPTPTVKVPAANYRQADQKTITSTNTSMSDLKRAEEQKAQTNQKTNNTPVADFKNFAAGQLNKNTNNSGVGDLKKLEYQTPSNINRSSSGGSLPSNVNPSWAANNPTLNKVLNTITSPLRNFQENTNVGRKATEFTRDYIAPVAFGGGLGGGMAKAGSALNTARLTPTIQKATNVAKGAVSNAPQMAIQGLKQTVKDVGSGYGGALQTGVNAIRNHPVAVGLPLGAGAVGAGAYALTGPWGGQGSGPGTDTPTNVDPSTQGSLTPQGNVNQGGGYGGGGFTPAPSNSMTSGAGTNMDWLPVQQTGANDMMLGQYDPLGQAQRLPQEMQYPQEMPYEMPQVPNFEMEYQQMMNVIQQAEQQNSALAATYMNQFTSYLDQMEAQIRDQYAQQGQTIDPATQAALAQIRQEVGRRREGLMEEMNRRGLLQSGVWLEMESRILNNQLTSEEQLLAGRLSDMQNRMTDSLMGLANQRLNTMGQMAQTSMQNQQAFGNMQVQAMQQMQSKQDQWNQWWAQQAETAKQQQQAQAQWNYEQQWNRDKQVANWTGTIPQGYPGAGQQTMDAKSASTTGAKGNNSLTNQYIQQVATYGNLQDALAELQRYRPVMEQQGVDTQAVINAIYGYFGQ